MREDVKSYSQIPRQSHFYRLELLAVWARSRLDGNETGENGPMDLATSHQSIQAELRAPSSGSADQD